MAVYIENTSKTKFNFHYRQTINKCISCVLADKKIPDDLDINVLIVTEEEIRSANNDNRNIDKVTDVLSFPYFEYDLPGVWSDMNVVEPEDILGDILICGEKIKEQAAEYGHSEKREMAFLIVHSMLHILGYDHIQPDDAEQMEAEQKRFMELLKIYR